MQVNFYTFSKRINSTAQPTGGASFSCVLKSPSSVTAPKISLVWGGGPVYPGAGENKFDGGSAIYKAGYYRGASGNELTSASYGYTTSYTKVKPDTVYTISGLYTSSSNTCRLYYLEEDGTWIDRSGTFTIASQPYTFRTPANCSNMQIQVPTANVSLAGCMLVEGPTSEPFVPYVPGSGNPSAYNYAYIPDYNRYYWVSNWTYADRQWSADLTVDVLASYKSYIGGSSKYVLRAADITAWGNSLDVIDTSYPATAKKKYTRKTATWSDWGPGRYVIGVIGAGNTQQAGGIGLYQATESEAHTIIANAYNAMTGIVNGAPAVTMPSSVEEGLQIIGNLANWAADAFLRVTGRASDFITSLMYFPFAFPGDSPASVQLGLIESGTGTARTLTGLIKQITASISLSDGGAPIGASYNMPPYKTIWLSVPPFGSFTLDAADIWGSSTLRLVMDVDALSGGGILRVMVDNPDVANEYIMVAQRTAQVGVMIPVGGNTIAPLSMASGAMTAIESIASENYVGALAGIGTMANASTSASKNSGGSAGLAALTGEIRLYYRYLDPADADPTEHGEPVCAIYTINTLSGYIQCRDGEISAPATSAELAQIASYLTGGFFYE